MPNDAIRWNAIRWNAIRWNAIRWNGTRARLHPVIQQSRQPQVRPTLRAFLPRSFCFFAVDPRTSTGREATPSVAG